MRTLDDTEFDALFTGASDSIVRVETHPEYRVTEPTERAALEAWRRGLPQPPRTVLTDPYLAEVAATVARGVRWERIRLLDDPLTDYQRWEIGAYAQNAIVGEHVLVTFAQLTAAARVDFWLFDDRHPVLMDYGPRGEMIGLRLVDESSDVADACRTRITELRRDATPLHDYLAAGEVARAS